MIIAFIFCIQTKSPAYAPTQTGQESRGTVYPTAPQAYYTIPWRKCQGGIL